MGIHATCGRARILRAVVTHSRTPVCFPPPSSKNLGLFPEIQCKLLPSEQIIPFSILRDKYVSTTWKTRTLHVSTFTLNENWGNRERKETRGRFEWDQMAVDSRWETKRTGFAKGQIRFTSMLLSNSDTGQHEKSPTFFFLCNVCVGKTVEEFGQNETILWLIILFIASRKMYELFFVSTYSYN